MFRRIAPTLLILACFLLDTTLLPIVYRGVFAVPLTAVAVMLIGMLLGRMSGLLYGTIGGLLIDITSGTLGLMMFFFMALGYLIGLILYSDGENLPTGRRNVRKRRMKRVVWVFALYAIGEIALFVFQYFNTAALHWRYFLNIAVRSLICTGLTLLLRQPAYAMLVGKNRGRIPTRNREVKSF